jgi:hypothetical protein
LRGASRNSNFQVVDSDEAISLLFFAFSFFVEKKKQKSPTTILLGQAPGIEYSPIPGCALM